jgi:hypothetical protein
MKTKLLLTLMAGTLLATAQPSVEAITPLNGTGPSATFTSVYRHAGGLNKSYLAYLLILPTPNVVQFVATGSCLIEYNRISNGMRLIDNAGTGWISAPGRPLEGAPVGPGGTVLSNNFCSVHTATVTVTSSANDLTIRVPVNFQGSLTGPMGTFLQLADVDDNWTGMTQIGNWTAYPISTPKPGPYVGPVTVTPHPQEARVPMKVVVRSGNTIGGLNAVSMVNVLVAEKIVGGTLRCHVVYLPASREIRLINQAGTGFVTTSPQENGHCAIGSFHGELMFASGSTNEVTLNIPMVFNPQFVTTQLRVWANTFDTSGNLTHWIGAQ